MASVFLAGTDGSVAWAGTGTTPEQGITSWTFEATIQLIEITSVDDTTWKNFTAGRKDWTATIETLDAGADPATVNERAELILGDGVSGSNLTLALALCTNVSVNTDQDDVVRTTYTFTSGGSIN
jgi:hypothetical protein